MKIIPPPFERASNNPWNFPYEFPGFYPTRWITINFHAKTSQSRESNNTGLRVKLFSTRRSVFLIGVGGGGTKKTPFLIPAVALFHLEQALYSDWIAMATIHRLILFPPSLLFLTQCVYEVHSRGWIAARFNSDFGKRSSILFGLTSFFSCICR